MTLTAEIAEAHYGKARRSYAEQTHSIGLQIHYNRMLAMETGHTCSPTFKFRPYGKSHMDYAVVDRSMHCYRYYGVATRGFYNVKRYLLSRLDTNDDLEWATVGVFKVVGIQEHTEKLAIKDVRGRGVIQKGKARFLIWTRDMQDM